MNNIHRWAIMPTCTVVRVHWCMHPCTCTALALCHCTCSISSASRHLSGYEGNFGINFVSLSGVVFLTLLLCTVYVGKYLLGKMYSMHTQFHGHAHVLARSPHHVLVVRSPHEILYMYNYASAKIFVFLFGIFLLVFISTSCITNTVRLP